jgi:hypothetical protein
MTVFVAAKAAAAGNSFISSLFALGTFHQFYLRAGSGGVYDTSLGANLQSASFASFVADEWAVFCMVYEPGEKVKVYYNGSLDGESLGTIADMEQGGWPLDLGGEGLGTSNHTGDHAESIIFPFALTSTEMTAVTDYLKSRWVDVPATPVSSGHDLGFDDGHG